MGSKGLRGRGCKWFYAVLGGWGGKRFKAHNFNILYPLPLTIINDKSLKYIPVCSQPSGSMVFLVASGLLR